MEKCTVCHALIDEEDLFCANCGTESPLRGGDAEHVRTGPQAKITATHNFDCTGCGASMSYDASASTLRCPFCGSVKLEPRRDATVLSPNRVVPFAVDQARAHETMRRSLGSSFWHPSDLSSSAEIEAMQPVYVPFWVFAARTFTYWTADTDQVPFGSSGKWRPLAGEHRGQYSGVLIGASSILTPDETQRLSPFDLGAALPTAQVDLTNAVYEQFRVQRKYARPLAEAGLEQLELEACRPYVPGNARNLKVNMLLDGLTSEPVLLPVWVMAYRYQDKVYRFLINGQTGHAIGTAPTSWRKLLAVVGGILLAVAAVGIIISLIARLNR